MKNEKLISSLKDLQLQMPRIIEAHGSNQELTLLALANPILALKKAGYALSPEAEEEIEATIRFGREDSVSYLDSKKELKALTKNDNLFKSAESLADGIEKYLSQATGASLVTISKKAKTKKEEHPAAKSTIDFSMVNLRNSILQKPKKIEGKILDSLSDFKALNPVIPLLLKVRSFDESSPALASEESIGEIMSRAKSSPLQNITFKMNRNHKK